MIPLTDGQGYSLAHEVLASIPPEPASVSLNDLREDFGIRTQAELGAIFENLRSSARGLGRTCAVGLSSWPAAKKIAEDYWKRLYGE